MPATTAAAAPSAVAAASLDLLRELLTGIDVPLAIRLWDGRAWQTAPGEPRITIVVNRPDGLVRLLHSATEAALVDAYLDGDLDLEGDIFAAKPVGRAILQRPRGLRGRGRLLLRAVALRRAARDSARGDDNAAWRREPALRGLRHTPARDRAAVSHHYDVSNRFYSLFLDAAMVYSCAVFAEPTDSLDTAQQRKLDLICRKLRLRPGERLLDTGCGWGALIMHAARTYGVEAVGITLSERQAELARERIRSAGLNDRCRVELCDYRSVQGGGTFDHIASIGMFEHVGSERAPDYFAAVHRLLRPGGTYLHHAIAGNPLAPRRRGPTLSNHYVFPDHELVPLGPTVMFAEAAGLDVRDVENLREHYALTLRRWTAALETRHDELVAEVGEQTWRAWRLVFAGAATAFESGEHRLFQILMVKPAADGRAGLPLLRNDWYHAG